MECNRQAAVARRCRRCTKRETKMRDYPDTAIKGLTYQSQKSMTENVIREAGPAGKAKEALGYLNEIDSLLCDLRNRLYGPSPEPAGNEANSVHEPCLEEMLRRISERTAMAVGDLRNLLSKLD